MIATDRFPGRSTAPAGARNASRWQGWARAGAWLLLPVATAAAARSVGFNSASAGFVMLVAVLVLASRQPFPVAGLGAVLSALLYNYFFFPPTGTFTIEDPENWIALAAFLLVSILAGRLLARERHQAERARSSQSEVEGLYSLSLELLRGSRGIEPIGDAAVRYLERIGARSGGVILFGSSPQHQKVLAWMGSEATDEVEDIAAAVGRHRRVIELPSRFGRDLGIPLRVADRVSGAFMIRGIAGAEAALESAASLLSFAIERERFLEERSHVEARRESDELKTSLLQAVSHDLKSPLTVLAVESEALERSGVTHPNAQQHVRAIRGQVGRIQRRIDNLLSVARFEAGVIAPRSEPTPAADLFRVARESLPTVTAVRPIHASVEDDTPDVLADPSLVVEIIVNLLENAHQASPEGETVGLSARSSPERDGRVWIEIEDRGEGLSMESARALRSADVTSFTRGGLGMELARRLAVLSGGSVEWFPRPGGGTTARVELPAASMAEASS